MKTKNKKLLIISSCLLILFLVLTILNGIFISTTTDWVKADNTSAIRNSVLLNDDRYAFSLVEDEKYYVISKDKYGKEMFKKEMPSSISMLHSSYGKLYVGSNRRLYVFTVEGDLIGHQDIAFDAVSMAISKEKSVAAVVTRYKVNDNQLYFYKISEDGSFIKINDIQVKKTITQIVAGENGVFYLGTGSQVFSIKDDGSKYSMALAAEFSAINSFTGVAYFRDKIYLANNQGQIDIYSKTEAGYSLNSAVKYGEGGSIIEQNDNDECILVDYLGNSVLYSLKEDKVIVKFKSMPSASNYDVNNALDVLVAKSLENLAFYSKDKISAFSFCNSTKIPLYVLDAAVIVFFAIALICVFDAGRKKIKTVATKINKGKVAYLYLLPVFILLGWFCYYPIAWGMTLAFQEYLPGIRQEFVGFSNFIQLFSDSDFWNGFLNMGIFLVTDIIKAIIPPIIVAETMHCLINKKTQYWARIFMYIPGVLPGVVATLLWKDGILGTDGVLSQLFGIVGIEKYSQWAWLGNDATAKWALVFIGFPWVGQYLIYYGALASIPSSIYEAAELDGFSWVKRIIYIDIPMIKAQMKYILVTTFIASIQNFSRV